jgi:hypothetical protein
MATVTPKEPDTDINKVVQANRVYVAWPAMVHKFTPGVDGAQGTFAHKRVENEKEQAQWLKAGWFKTPLEAESAATHGKPHRTQNETLPEDEALPEADADATDDSGAPKGKRR